MRLPRGQRSEVRVRGEVVGEREERHRRGGFLGPLGPLAPSDRRGRCLRPSAAATASWPRHDPQPVRPPCGSTSCSVRHPLADGFEQRRLGHLVAVADHPAARFGAAVRRGEQVEPVRGQRVAALEPADQPGGRGRVADQHRPGQPVVTDDQLAVSPPRFFSMKFRHHLAGVSIPGEDGFARPLRVAAWRRTGRSSEAGGRKRGACPSTSRRCPRRRVPSERASTRSARRGRSCLPARSASSAAGDCGPAPRRGDRLRGPARLRVPRPRAGRSPHSLGGG